MNKIVSNASIYIIGNKLDLTKQRAVSEDQILKMKERLKVDFYEISAKTGENVSLLFYSSISNLSPFSEFEEDKDKLIKFLEEENKQEVSALYSSNNRDVLNITTRK